MNSLPRMLGVLVFLGAGVTLLALSGLGAFLLVSRRWSDVRRVAIAMAAVLGLYAVTLLAYGMSSRSRSLAPFEEKFFCGADCDLAFSVVAVEVDSASNPEQKLWRISVRARSDAVRVTLRPSSAGARVLDERGQGYDADATATRALDPTVDARTPFEFDLGPKESRVVRLAFILPADVEKPELLLTEGGWVGRLVPGDEQSPFHGKTTFRLFATESSPASPPALGH